MFSKILGKLKGKTDNSNQELIIKISKMDLTDMRAYINNKILDLSVDEDGLNIIMHKLLEINENTSKRYIQIDDMDSKKKKAFELILNLLSNKKVTVVTIELANNFLKIYKDIIEQYDKDNKQIYYSKLKDAIHLAIDEINGRTDLERKIKIIS